MKLKTNDDGTVTIKNAPRELVVTLGHIASDIGANQAVLYYDPRSYEAWARPTKSIRKALSKFAKVTDTLDHNEDADDWGLLFENTDGPKFNKRDPFGRLHPTEPQ